MYTKDFNLTPKELEIIERALNDKMHRLNTSRQTVIDSTIVPPEEIASVKEYDAQVKEIVFLLAKFHHQKTWYKPKDQIYVSG